MPIPHRSAIDFRGREKQEAAAEEAGGDQRNDDIQRILRTVGTDLAIEFTSNVKRIF